MVKSLRLIIALLAICANVLCVSASIIGNWKGSVAGLDLIFHISQSGEGEYSATMDSPMQGASGIPVEKTTFSNDTLTLTMPSLRITYTGTYDSTDDSIKGTFFQNGFTLPLNLTRSSDVRSGPDRPQEAAIPGCDYSQEEVTFKNDGLTFSGTLTLPRRDTKGVVLLVSGSGHQDRDESIMGHKPFAVIADYLACHGWASLRYDDRGVGGSSPGKASDTTFDFASDALSALEFLAHRAEFKSLPIGLAGHSEGALIGMILAAEHPDALSFLISISGPALPGGEIMTSQNRLLAVASGADEKTADEVASSAKALYDLYTMFSTPEELNPAIESILRRNNAPNADAQLRMLTSPWFVKFVTTDPAKYMKEIKCPVLAIAGEYDAQVEPESSLAAMQRDIRNLKCVRIPKANHMMQESDKFVGSTDYYSISQIFSPKALSAITDWLDSVFLR